MIRYWVAAIASGLVALGLFGYLGMVAWAVLTGGPHGIGAGDFNAVMNALIYCTMVGCMGVLAASWCRTAVKKLRAH